MSLPPLPTLYLISFHVGARKVTWGGSYSNGQRGETVKTEASRKVGVSGMCGPGRKGGELWGLRNYGLQRTEPPALGMWMGHLCTGCIMRMARQVLCIQTLWSSWDSCLIRGAVFSFLWKVRFILFYLFCGLIFIKTLPGRQADIVDWLPTLLLRCHVSESLW